jgi:hypothetical protein
MATHAPRFSSLDLPRPFRSAAPLVALAVAAALFDIDPRLPWAVGAIAGVCFAVAAAARWTTARLELAAVRRTADRLIVYSPHTYEAPDLVLWRTNELIEPEARTRLRHEFERMLKQLDPARLPSSSPLRRVAARRHEDALRAVAARVGDERPVSARGLLLARDLLRSPSSPLYAEDAEVQLARTLSRILGALEP